MKHRLIWFLAALLLLTGCSTLKGWFTPQGQKLAQARDQSKAGHPLAASVLAAEALSLEPGYKDAEDLLLQSFSPGQAEYQALLSRWSGSSDPERWDHLFELYRGQNTLRAVLPKVGNGTLVVDDVTAEGKQAGRNAALFHWDKARSLAATPGPRQARKALAEGRTAAGYDGQTPGLADWLAGAAEAATQKLLVVPFFSDLSGPWGGVSVPLASQISRHLLDDAGLPELTEVFSSDRLVTLPGGGPARLGLISQPDALKLAETAGQNLVLLGQLTRTVWQEPRKTVSVASRERRVVLVDPDHPQGVEKVFGAKVTTTVWTTAFAVSASFSVVEAATGRDVATGFRDAEASDRTVGTAYTGDREALNADDLAAVAQQPVLADRDTLRDRAIASLAAAVAEAVRQALR
jgi:hypothetical protein